MMKRSLRAFLLGTTALRTVLQPAWHGPAPWWLQAGVLPHGRFR